MVSHRLSRLALLTQGAALVGLGLSQLACGQDPPPPAASPANEPTHINAPGESPKPPRHVNAPDTTPPDAGPPPPVASASPSAAPYPIHVNSPPQQPPKKP